MPSGQPPRLKTCPDTNRLLAAIRRFTDSRGVADCVYFTPPLEAPEIGPCSVTTPTQHQTGDLHEKQKTFAISFVAVHTGCSASRLCGRVVFIGRCPNRKHSSPL